MVAWEVFHNKINPFPDCTNPGYMIASYETFRPMIDLSIPKWASQLMQQCWSHHAQNRPSFNEIVLELELHTE